MPDCTIPSRSATVTVDDLPGYRSVFVTNARGVAAVDSVDGRPVPVDEAFLKTLREVYDTAPWDPI